MVGVFTCCCPTPRFRQDLPGTGRRAHRCSGEEVFVELAVGLFHTARPLENVSDWAAELVRLAEFGPLLCKKSLAEAVSKNRS